MNQKLITPLSLSLILAGGVSQACSGDQSVGGATGGQANAGSTADGGSMASGGSTDSGGGDAAGGTGGLDPMDTGGTSATGGMGGSMALGGFGGVLATGGETASGGDVSTGGNPPLVEICDNVVDDDGDEAIDCDDSDCAEDRACYQGCLPPAAYDLLSTTDADIPAAGLALWVRADVGVGTEANHRVCTWEDQSGNGHHLEQTDPSLRPMAGAALGGQAAIDFDARQILTRNDVLDIGSTNGRSFFAVAQAESLTERAYFLYQGKPGVVGMYVAIDINTFNTSGQRFGAYMTNNAYDSNLATDLAPHIHSVFVDSMSPGGVVLDNYHYSVDGQGLTLTRTSGGLGNSLIEDFSVADKTGVGNANIHIAEALIYDGALSAENRAKVVAYLKARYGI